MTATTAMPEAVLTGFARNLQCNDWLQVQNPMILGHVLS